MDSVDVGDKDVFAQHRTVDQVVDACAERLNPFQFGAGAQYVIRQARREGQQDIRFRDIRSDLGMVIHQVDIQFWEFRFEAVAILIVQLWRQRQKDQQICHAGEVPDQYFGGKATALYRPHGWAAKYGSATRLHGAIA